MSGQLFIVCGAPGTGKSTHARKLAAERQATLLELDTASERVVQAALRALNRDPDDRDSPFYKATFREPIYATLFALAEENLPHGDVILVGPFTRELRDATWPEYLRRRFGGTVEIHHVVCSLETRLKRLQERANPRDRNKLKAWAEHASYYAGTEEPAFPCKVIHSRS